jgi:hypothetical protein
MCSDNAADNAAAEQGCGPGGGQLMHPIRWPSLGVAACSPGLMLQPQLVQTMRIRAYTAMDKTAHSSAAHPWR